METCKIIEALAGGESLFGIVIESRDHDAFEHQFYANNRMGMVLGISSRQISNEEEARLPAGAFFDG